MPVEFSILASWTAQLWQWHARLPSRSDGSISLDRRAQPAQRLTQIIILYVRESVGDPRSRCIIDFGRLRRFPASERGLSNGNSADGLPTEETIDPFENDR
jgi:hypothetical protein